MKQLHSYSRLLISLVVVFICLLFAVIFYQSKQVVEAAPICTGTVSITNPVQNESVGSLKVVEVAGTSGITYIKILLNGNSIGRALQEPSSTGFLWRMLWDTTYAKPGSNYELKALINYSSGIICETQPVFIKINNTFEQPLAGFMQPQSWTGFTNGSTFFNVSFAPSVANTSVDISRFADVIWTVSGRGSIEPQPFSKAKYYSGPVEGTGTVKAEVAYGGKTFNVESGVSVLPQTTTTSSSGSTSQNTQTATQQFTGTIEDTNNDGIITDDDLTGAEENLELENTSESENTPSTTIVKVLQQDSTIKSCIESQLGEGSLTRILEENRRPRTDEFGKYIGCFARQKYIIPAALAPVAPEEVARRPESNTVTINKISNSKAAREYDGGDQTVLVLSGSAKPDSNVLVYIFSEPLVLVVTADSEGNWVYELQDPLEEGRHEVYALVDRGDGEYDRSALQEFFIREAAATSENPNGYSLELVEEVTVSANNRSVNILVVSTIILVVFSGLTLFIFVLNRKYRHRQMLPQSMVYEATQSYSDQQEQSQLKDFHDSL